MFHNLNPRKGLIIHFRSIYSTCFSKQNPLFDLDLNYFTSVCSVADPDTESTAFLIPGSGMNMPDHISNSLETFFGVKNT